MYPTLQTRDFVVMDKITEVENIPKNSLVRFTPPEQWNEHARSSKKYDSFLKRVVAAPGDIVEIDSNHFYVNGNIFIDHWQKRIGVVDFKENTYFKRKLNENEYFVVGDNWKQSFDSFFIVRTSEFDPIVTRDRITDVKGGETK